MRVYATLIEAKKRGEGLALCGYFPTIYKMIHNGYALAKNGEWPLPRSYPAFKWDGENWLMIPIRLNTMEKALEFCDRLKLLGYDAVAVEFHGFTYDVFLSIDHVPKGVWIISMCAEDEEIIREEIVNL
ncbi:MAG: hypothetical protein GF411_03355 [Candidatus Lokiarchaeota archaeon]|nr:hypothetical protein [Candidatus Lokiarchaeota archaeon]